MSTASTAVWDKAGDASRVEPGFDAKDVDSYFLEASVDYARDKANGDRVRVVLWWVTGLSMLLNIALGLSLSRVALGVKVVPYVVQVDEHGYAVPIQPADETSFESPIIQKAIMRQLNDWVSDWRRVLPDNEAQRAAVRRVFAQVPTNSAAAMKVEAWFDKNPLFQKGRTVETAIHFVGPADSDRLWKVEWTERERTAMAVRDRRYEALLTVEFSPVTNREDIVRNPVGVFVVDVFVQEQVVR